MTEKRFGLSFNTQISFYRDKKIAYLSQPSLHNGYSHVTWLLGLPPASQRMLSFTGGGSPCCLLVEQPPCALHATSKIGSCYYETRTELKQMALKRYFKKPHFHQHVQCCLCKGYFLDSVAVCRAVTDVGLGLKSSEASHVEMQLFDVWHR